MSARETFEAKYAGVFDQTTIRAVGGVAATLSGVQTYAGVLELLGNAKTETFTPDHSKPMQIMDLSPEHGYERVLALQLEVGTGIDENAVMHLAPIALSMPDTRLIAFGRPSAKGNRYNRLTLRQAWKVGRGDFSPYAQSSLAYLASRHIGEAIHAGFSLGGDIVPEVPKHAERFKHRATAIVSIDGVSGTRRRFPHVLHLASDFKSAGGALPSYIAEIETPAFTEARQLSRTDESVNLTAFLRLSTIASGFGLARAGLQQRIEDGLNTQTDTVAVLLNCGESEVVDQVATDSIRQALIETFGPRVKGRAFPGLKHGANDQIYVNAAMMYEGVKLALAI